MNSFTRSGAFLPNLAWLSLAAALAGQSTSPVRFSSLLPADAKIVETKDLSVGAGTTRALVLWMSHPKRVMASWDSGPDFVYGDHWFGSTSLSLIDLSNRRLINTIRIHPPNDTPADSGGYAVPFFTSEAPYYVPQPNTDHRGTPLLLHLLDLTGEGVVGQFVLFDYVATGISYTSVFGYSPKSDSAVHYPIEVIEDRFRPVVQFWVTQIFATKPIPPGYWNFTCEAGHGSWAWIHEEVRFHSVRQLFVDRRTTRPYPGLSEMHCDLEIRNVPELLRIVGRIVTDFDATKTRDVQSLIDTTPANTFTATAVSVTFQREEVDMQLEWLKSDGGKIGIELTAATKLVAAIRTDVKAWCTAE